MKDFSSISPSAKSIILMKGHTSIPFAREAAELVSLPNAFVPDFSNRDLLFWSKVLHFETRYLGINQLIGDIDVDCFLELSSGYAFRCLEVSGETGKFYIDTDLPDLIEKKKHMLDSFQERLGVGNTRLLPLNALNEDEFKSTVNELPAGRVAIINEGLLIYFDKGEKEKLCRIIRSILKERGGYWITSDIYVRATAYASSINHDKKFKAFKDRHNIEDNKFSSFEEARQFFEKNGFFVDQEESLDITQLSSYQYVSKLAPPSVETEGGKSPKLRTSWRLRIAD